MLPIRMVLYFISAAVAGQSLGTFDPELGTLTLDLARLELAIGGLVTFLGTFAASRRAKRNGGAT